MPRFSRLPLIGQYLAPKSPPSGKDRLLQTRESSGGALGDCGSEPKSSPHLEKKRRRAQAMHRRTQRTAAHLAIFLFILALLIYINNPPSRSGTFTWSKIRYRSTASSPADSSAYGRCPGLSKSTKPALVVSHVESDGDISWLKESGLKGKYHICLYDVDDSLSRTEKNMLRVPSNRAHEAMAYLTFLIDNYDSIPKTGAVFIHGSRFAWHNDSPDYDNAFLLSQLDVGSALEPAGYHNLRCDWSVSMCLPSSPPQGSLQMKFQSAVDPFDKKAASDRALPGALGAIFGDGQGDLGGGGVSPSRHEAVRSQCCAQFVVSRGRIRSHAREEYVALRQWLLDGADGLPNSRAMRREGLAPRDDRVAGRIISYIWHILFLDVGSGSGYEGGKDLDLLNRAACPSAQDCYCRLYGRCDLKCRSASSCFGQYKIPPGYKVPNRDDV